MAEPTSLLSRLREQRERAMAPKRMTLEVPGYAGMLHIRYKPIPWEELTALLASSSLDAKAALKSNAAALVEACDAVLAREHDDSEPVSLADLLRQQGESIHGEVRFDAYLVDALDLKIEDELEGPRAPEGATETVLALFAGAVSPELAIAEHAARLGAWMRGAAEDVDEALLGG